MLRQVLRQRLASACLTALGLRLLTLGATPCPVRPQAMRQRLAAVEQQGAQRRDEEDAQLPVGAAASHGAIAITGPWLAAAMWELVCMSCIWRCQPRKS